MARLAKPDPVEERNSPGEGVLRELVGYNVKRAYMALQPAAQAAMAEYDLRVPSFSCLSVIVQNPGIAPSVLAECLKMERSNIVVVIDELESRELVNRTQSTTDRRRYALTATMRGKRLHDKTVAAVHRNEERLLYGLNATERAKLLELLNKIEKASTL